jgi:peptidoglycan/LPS O-acetylase OafA/YrhL
MQETLTVVCRNILAAPLQSQDPALLQRNPRLTRNNFDVLRLVFAGSICLVHAYVLSGFHELAGIVRILSSAVAVEGFFVVSGFLIFMSYERSSSLASYIGKRVRRIYPAYFTVVMLSALGLVAVSSKSFGEYFSFAWVKYVFANLAFLNFMQQTLPRVFELNNLSAVNGALWTLKIEVMFYLIVPAFVFLFRNFSPQWPNAPDLIFTCCSAGNCPGNFPISWPEVSSITFCRCLKGEFVFSCVRRFRFSRLICWSRFGAPERS